MKKEETIIEPTARTALLSCLSSVPFLKSIEIHQESSKPIDRSFDIKAVLELAERTVTLFAEVKTSGQPRIARQAVNQMLRYKGKFPDAYFVFIAPYISSKSAEICESEGVGHLDFSGNCLLSFDNIFIQKKDYPNQFIEKRDLKSLYAPKAERVLRALLCNPGREWKIKELAAESAVSLGQASNVKKILVDQELVSGKRGGFRLIDPVAVLSEWAENYDYRKNKVQEFYSFKSVADVENTLATYCNNWKIKYALTGFSGAARIEPAVRYKKAMAYAGALKEEDFLRLSLKKVKSGGNLLLLTPYDDGVFYGSRRVDDIQVVSDMQVYLDLQSFRGRGEEAAQVLYERIADQAW